MNAAGVKIPRRQIQAEVHMTKFTLSLAVFIAVVIILAGCALPPYEISEELEIISQHQENNII